jgi:hypothetical protein
MLHCNMFDPRVAVNRFIAVQHPCKNALRIYYGSSSSPIPPPSSTPEQREALRRDAGFSRKLRFAVDGAVSKVFYVISLTMMITVGGALVVGLAAMTGIRLGGQ